MFLHLFVSRVGMTFAWQIESVFAEFLKVLMMVCAHDPKKEKTPSTPRGCIRSLDPKTNLGNPGRNYWAPIVPYSGFNQFNWKVRPPLTPLSPSCLQLRSLIHLGWGYLRYFPLLILLANFTIRCFHSDCPIAVSTSHVTFNSYKKADESCWKLTFNIDVSLVALLHSYVTA